MSFLFLPTFPRASTPAQNLSKQSLASNLSIDSLNDIPPSSSTTTHSSEYQARNGFSRILRKNKLARRMFIWSGTAVCTMFGLGLVFVSTGLIPFDLISGGNVTALGYDNYNRTGILAEINANLTRIYNQEE